jgi:hypothetical protein
VFVVRDDELDPVLLAEDASRFRERFSEWADSGSAGGVRGFDSAECVAPDTGRIR